MIKKILLFFIFIYFLHFLHAARPMNTDDARVVPYGHCQVETWSEFHFDKSSSIWALPGCNLFHDTEITLGGMTGLNSSALQFSVKKLFVNADKERWGIGIALGNIYSEDVAKVRGNDMYIYIPASVNFFNSRLVVHVNLGYRLQDFRTNVFNVGLGTEVSLSDRIYFIGEVFYVYLDKPAYQFGLRTWIVEDMLQIDSTYGNTFENDGAYISVGLRMISTRLKK